MIAGGYPVPARGAPPPSGSLSKQSNTGSGPMSPLLGLGLGRRSTESERSSPPESVAGVGQLRQPGGFEKRIAWLEEDVAVMRRRVQDECRDDASAASGDSSLWAIVARLDSQLNAERISRERLDGRIVGMETSIRNERKDRETQLRGFSHDLEKRMRGLIENIDTGLNNGAAAMRQRTDDTENRLRALIARVDVGLSAGASALQSTLTNEADTTPRAKVSTPIAGVDRTSRAQALSPGLSQGLSTNKKPQEAAVATSEQLMQSYEHLRQENQKLLERQAALRSKVASTQGSIKGSPSLTPQSGGLPPTMQVPGSNISLGSRPEAPKPWAAPRSNAGLDQRFRPAGPRPLGTAMSR